jgi:hypothetical protein
MPPPPGPPHDVPVLLLVMLVVALCVKFWRTALALVAIAVITLTIYAAILLAQGLQHAHR